MGHWGGYKNEPKVTLSVCVQLGWLPLVCQVKWAPQNVSCFSQCLRLGNLQSDSVPYEAPVCVCGNPPTLLLFKTFVPWHWTPQGSLVWYPIQTLLSVCVCVFLMLVKCQQCRTHEFAPETRTKLWKTAVTHAARPNTYLSYICIYNIYVYIHILTNLYGNS